MMPSRADAADSRPAVRDGSSRPENDKLKPILVLPSRAERQGSNPQLTALSPPPVPKTPPPQHKKSHFRLRSDSGLSLHTNQAAFRQYTDYNGDGSVSGRTPRARALSVDANSSVEDFALAQTPSTEPELRGFVSHGRILPDFFEPAVIRSAFSDPETGPRLRRFAQARHGGADIEFLLKVEEYSRILGNMISSMSYISSNFTGTTATSPLGLPPEVASHLKSNTKYCARAALPALDKLYQDAKPAVEERLSRGLYPEFVKHQLSRCMTAALSASQFPRGESGASYPGLGDAFCLTDPLQPDNPVVAVSDGLSTMSGYRRGELVGKNCRLLQGVATDPDTARRLSHGVSSGSEMTELIINYRPDGTPYWNFLYICPLMENGGVRYFLGAQINVSENMGAQYRDIRRVLNFGPPPEDCHPDRAAASHATANGTAPQSSDNTELEQGIDDQQGERRTSRRRRLFRRFRRKSPLPRRENSSTSGTSTRPSTSSEAAPDDSPPAPVPHRCYATPLSPNLDHHQQQLDEHSTPYSRFLVMRYSPPVPPKQPPLPPQQQQQQQQQHQSYRYHQVSRTEQAGKRLTRDRDRKRSRSRDRARSGGEGSPKQQQHDRHQQPQRSLPIAYCSPFALGLLGLRPHESPATAVVDRDVFSVLSSRLGSPSVNRALKAHVMGSIAAGESVTVDLMAPADSPAFSAPATSSHATGGSDVAVGYNGAARGRQGSVSSSFVSAGEANGSGSGHGKGHGNRHGNGNGNGNGNGSSSGNINGNGNGNEDVARPRASSTLDRGAEFFSQVLFGGGSHGRMRRLVSRWVPLKDGDGRVQWVVLVLVPADGSSSV